MITTEDYVARKKMSGRWAWAIAGAVGFFLIQLALAIMIVVHWSDLPKEVIVLLIGKVEALLLVIATYYFVKNRKQAEEQ